MHLLLAKFRVPVVFQGHDHTFAKRVSFARGGPTPEWHLDLWQVFESK